MRRKSSTSSLANPFGLLAFLVFLAPLHGAVALDAAPADAAPADEGLTKIELLGKRVFEDKSLSVPAGVACASCHDPARGFQGDNGSPHPGVARGSKPDAFGARNTPSIMYGSFAPPFAFIDEKDEETGKIEKTPVGGQFLDGRARDLLAQFEGPLLNPVEMNAPSKRFAVERIRDGAYAGLAREVYGEQFFGDPEAAFEKIAQAVVAFEATERFHPFKSKFDDYVRGEAQLSPLEAKGFELFKNEKKGNCLACHVGNTDSKDPRDWLFTDYTYDALGAPKNMAIPGADKPDTAPDLGLCKQPGIEKIAPAGFDLNGVCGAFKVPTLRNVAITGPYLHNGVFTKLRDVVAFYATRDTDPARWFPKTGKKVAKFNDLPSWFHKNVNTNEVPYDRKAGEKPRLSDEEIDAITAFLETLTDKP